MLVSVLNPSTYPHLLCLFYRGSSTLGPTDPKDYTAYAVQQRISWRNRKSGGSYRAETEVFSVTHIFSMRRKHLKSSYSSESSYYPSSLSSSYSGLSSTQSPSLSPRDHLETLISRHGYPTPVSLSSLRDLRATSSRYNPPSPRPRRYRSDSPPSDAFDSLSLSATTRPIPIPRRAVQVYDDDLPVTPLTGRFDKDDYFDDWERASLSAKSRHVLPPSSGRRGRHSSMRSDNSPFYSPVASPTMSPRQPSSPQPSRSSRTQAPAKSVPGFHLGTLPRFHPAVYQPSTSSTTQGQPPSPRQSRQHTYRTVSGSAREVKWQYRDLLDGSNQSPSAPRLDPLRSPGPVTPLALESGDYLAAGSVLERVPRDGTSQHTGPPSDLVEKLIARENEKARQLSRKSAKGR